MRSFLRAATAVLVPAIAAGAGITDTGSYRPIPVDPPPAGSPKGRPVKRVARTAGETSSADRPPLEGLVSPVRVHTSAEAGTDAAGGGTHAADASSPLTRARPDQ